MNETNRRAARALVIGAAILCVAPAVRAKNKEILRLRAWAVNLNNSNARTSSIDIVIERWSTEEEIARLRGILIEEGGEKLLPALQKIKPRCGFVRGANTLGWDIYFARETALPGGGRKIVVATDRPVAMWEARNSTRSMDYQFSLAEIRIGADGKGEGKAIPSAQLSFNKETNTLEIENYGREPVRLSQVTVQK